MARTSTQPQATKQLPTRKRHLELKRRDKTVKFRNAAYRCKGDYTGKRLAIIDRTAGWDTIDSPLSERDDVTTFNTVDTEYFGFDTTFDVEPDMLPCGCIGSCEYADLYPDEPEPLADWERELLDGTFDDYATNEWGEPIDEQFDDEWGDSDEELDDDVVTYYDGYAKIGAVYVVDTGAGFGLDAVFGEGYLSGNCGFSVRTRP